MKVQSALLALSFAAVMHASTIGAVQVCYYCVTGPGVSNFGFGVQDSPIFQFTNVSATDITNASFAILASGDNRTEDTFQIGTIAAGSFFNLWVGVTSDGGSGHTFFTPGIAGGLDSSDKGPDSDAVQFVFDGTWNGQPLTSGVFAAGDSAGPALDGTSQHLNFLGGPGNGDGFCFNCFFGTVATLAPAAPTPEPGGMTLLGAGLAGLAIFTARFRHRSL